MKRSASALGVLLALLQAAANGTKPPGVEQANVERFEAASRRIHDGLVRRFDASAGKPAN
jgi:hypothetical protein